MAACGGPRQSSARTLAAGISSTYDPEVRRFSSISPDIQGLVVEADSFPELKEDTKDAARILVADMLFPGQKPYGKEPALALKGEGR